MTPRFLLYLRHETLGRLVYRARPLYYLAAWLWRRALHGTTFVAITGSLGKTTAKECLAAVLGTRFATAKSRDNQNSTLGVALNILRVRPWHRVAVLEVGAATPGQMAWSAGLLRPDVAVVLSVRRTHAMAYRALTDRALAKAQLLAVLPRDGLAVLNGDDPLVASMASQAPGRVLRVGTSPTFDLWADEVVAGWPDGLAFHVHAGEETHRVRTRLLGAHWLPGALAVLAVARHCGLALGEATRALSNAAPVPGRLQSVRLSTGAVVLRDDFNASVDAFDAALGVLRAATGVRRVLVVSDLSDFAGHRKHRLRYLAGAVPGAADVLLIVGESAGYGRRAAIRAGLSPDGVHAVATLAEAARLLPAILAPGDLVLLKGRTSDHVARLLFAQFGRVDCWKPVCSKVILCDQCWELGPAGVAALDAVSSRNRMRGAALS